MKDLKGKLGRFFVEDAKVETGDSGSGYLTGYLAVFGNIDLADERIIQGAFAKSLTEKISSGKVALMARHFAHGGDVEDMIGLVVEAKEDSYGLWIKAEYLEDKASQELRDKINSARKKGAKIGLSVGYRVIRYETDNSDPAKTIYNLTELELREGTVTVRPCNELAGITDSKSAPEALSRDALEEQLAAVLGVAKSTVTSALEPFCAGGAKAASTQKEQVPAGLADLQAALRANRILLETEYAQS